MISRHQLGNAYPIKKLESIVEFLDHRRRPVTESDRKPGPYPYYGANGQQGWIDNFLFDEPLVLLAEDGGHFDNPERGVAYLVNGKTWVNNHAHVLRPSNEIDVKFLCRVLENYDLSPFITGTTRGKLTKGGAAEIPVPVPPLEEQRRIAAILDQAETLRTQRRTALALLDSLTQSLFLDMFGDMRTEPDRWPKVPFEAIVKDSRIGLVRGSQELDDSHPYPYLRMNAITRDGELKLEGALRATATTEELETYCLRDGDFLFNTRNSRELVGKTALFRGNELYLFNNNLLRVRFVETAHPEYVVAAFKTQYVQNELELRKSGTTNVFAVYYKDLRTLPIPLPPLPLQQTFATRIASIEALKATHRRALAALDALFASLQQRAFAGQL